MKTKLYIALALTALMLVVFVACNGNDTDTGGDNSSTNSSVATEGSQNNTTDTETSEEGVIDDILDGDIMDEDMTMSENVSEGSSENE